MRSSSTNDVDLDQILDNTDQINLKWLHTATHINNKNLYILKFTI